MIECAPPSTLRSFNSARIKVGSDVLRVEVRFGRKKPDKNAGFSCPFGVAVDVSSDGSVSEWILRRIRDEIAKQIGRGGFSRGRPPTKGPDGDHADLGEALAERWRERHALAQGVFAAVTALVAALVGLAFVLIEAAGSGSEMPAVTTGIFLGSIVLIVQVASFPISTFLFPAIEIADVTPGRRIAQIVGRSGVVTAVAGVAGAYLKNLVG